MKLLNLENILATFFFAILISINSLYIYTLDLPGIHDFYTKFSIKNIFALFNYLRFYTPILLFPILVVILFSQRIKKPDTIIIIFIAYYCWQLFVFFISDRATDISSYSLNSSTVSFNSEKGFIWDNLKLVACALNLLLIFWISKNIDMEKFTKKILTIALIFIGLIAIYFIYQLLGESIKDNLKFIYGSKTLSPTGLTFEQATPRITGISRFVLIFYFLAFGFFIHNPKKIILYIILILLLLLIYKMQTRGAFVGIVLSSTILFLFMPVSLKKKIVIFLSIVILPVILFESYYYAKKLHASQYEYVKQEISKPAPLAKNRILTTKVTDSGRLVIWKNAFFIIKEKKIFLGYGPQSDRALLLQFKKEYQNSEVYQDKDGNAFAYDNNASNVFLYSYLCGGVAGLIFMILIYIISINTIIKKILTEKIFSSNSPLQMFATILLIYICLRGLFENSIALFSVDFIFFILSFLILQNKLGPMNANIKKENF